MRNCFGRLPLQKAASPGWFLLLPRQNHPRNCHRISFWLPARLGACSSAPALRAAAPPLMSTLLSRNLLLYRHGTSRLAHRPTCYVQSLECPLSGSHHAWRVSSHCARLHCRRPRPGVPLPSQHARGPETRGPETAVPLLGSEGKLTSPLFRYSIFTPTRRRNPTPSAPHANKNSSSSGTENLTGHFQLPVLLRICAEHPPGSTRRCGRGPFDHMLPHDVPISLWRVR